MRSAGFALVAATALAAAPAQAQDAAPPTPEDRFFLQFDGAWLGVFGLGDLTLDAYANGETYQVTAAVRSGGLAALFDRTQISAVSIGPMTTAGPNWGAYTLDHVYAAKRRVTMIRTGADGTVSTLITPGYRSLGAPPASPAQKAAARDPLATVLAMGAVVGRSRRCSGAFPVFDGRMHYTLTLTEAGFVRRHQQGGYDGPALRCRMRLTPVAGYDADEAKEARGWPAAEIWFGLVDGATFAPPVHVQIPFAVGDVSLTLRTYRHPSVEVQLPQAP